MQFSTILTLLAAAAPALAVPTDKRQASLLCAGLEGNPQCCATDVLDVADLNCINPPTQPTSVQNFIDVCAAVGQQAKCCALPVLGQALICQPPV